MMRNYPWLHRGAIVYAGFSNQLGNIIYGIVAADLDLVGNARAYGQGKHIAVILGIKEGPLPNWLVPGQGYRAAAFELGRYYAEKVRSGDEDAELLKKLMDRGFRAPFVENGRLIDGANIRSRVDDNISNLNLKPSTVKYNGPNTDPLTHKAYGINDSGNKK
jgi:hypothetical protein